MLFVGTQISILLSVGATQQYFCPHTSLTRRIPRSGPILFPLADFSQLVSSGVEAAWPRRLRSLMRSRRGGQDSDNSSRSRSRDSDPRDPLSKKAADGVASEYSIDHPSSIPEPWTTTWRRIHSNRQRWKKSCPVLARRPAGASPHQARWAASGWPLQALQHTNNRAQAMAGQPLAISIARRRILERVLSAQKRATEATLQRRTRLRHVQREM